MAEQMPENIKKGRGGAGKPGQSERGRTGKGKQSQRSPPPCSLRAEMEIRVETLRAFV